MLLVPRATRKELLRATGASTLGLELALSIVVGVVGGSWLDDYFGTKPVWFFIGFGFGLAAGGMSLYRVARRAQRELDSTHDEP